MEAWRFCLRPFWEVLQALQMCIQVHSRMMCVLNHGDSHAAEWAKRGNTDNGLWKGRVRYSPPAATWECIEKIRPSLVLNVGTTMHLSIRISVEGLSMLRSEWDVAGWQVDIFENDRMTFSIVLCRGFKKFRGLATLNWDIEMFFAKVPYVLSGITPVREDQYIHDNYIKEKRTDWELVQQVSGTVEFWIWLPGK